ncbi:fungal-specific transcription factor domain-containing protein [Aspergillus ambiguus]|uniref:transcription factor domain-containing protein n=1 Tax=Aspergillus ambiguus TaxID=176160 RepID=UPI003CCCABE3
MAESPNRTPRRHKRGLTRTAAACQRCKRRKQKCDGKTPTCGACAAAGVTCVLSDRWVVQHLNPDCQCDLLQSRLKAVENRYDALLREHEQLQLSQSTILQSEPQVRETTVGSTPSGPPVNIDQHFSGRILRPTFSHRPGVKGVTGSTLGSAWELWGSERECSDTPDQPTLALAQFNRDGIVSLVDMFFGRRWPYLPVLHRPTFVDHHLNPVINNSTASPISRFLVNIVCAIGATEKQLEQDNGHIHRLFFNEAAKDIHLVMEADDFECIQCLLLLCMYGHNEPQSVSMWYTTGMALHLALGLDLHRKEHLSGKSLFAAEMSKRVFWSAYVMSCSMNIHMGRPIGIQVSDITTPLPLQLTDEQLTRTLDDFGLSGALIPQVTDMSTFIHIIQLRIINARVYKSFHSIGCVLMESPELDQTRCSYYTELNQWLITAPRYMRTLSTFQSIDWFQIAFHHAVLSLYRPSRAAPIPSAEDLRICTESAIGLISSYSSLYARNKIKYTFVAIHSLFLAAVTMLYALRASSSIRHELTKPVIQTNISTFLTLFRGISNGRAVGEKCSKIVERLGNSILSLFDDENCPVAEVDTEFQSWFGLHSHTFATPQNEAMRGPEMTPQFQTFSIDSPWEDLFSEGIDMGYTDMWGFVS